MSVDPVTSNPSSGRSFNRYRYSNNNPYRYVDPDGRDPDPVIILPIPVIVPRPVVSPDPNRIDPFYSPVRPSQIIFSREDERRFLKAADSFLICIICRAFNVLLSEVGGQPKETDLVIVPEKDGNKVAVEEGYKDAHDAKDGRGDSKVNIYTDKTTGRRWLWNGARGSQKDPL